MFKIVLFIMMTSTLAYAQRDDEQEWLDRRPSPVMFSKRGTLRTEQATGHIAVTLPIVDLGVKTWLTLILVKANKQQGDPTWEILQQRAADNVDKMEAIIDVVELTDKYEGNKTWALNNKEIFWENWDKVNKATDTTAVEKQNILARKRRFIVAAIAAGALAFSGGLGVYNTVRLQEIEAAVEGNTDTAKVLVAGVNELQTAVGLATQALQTIHERFVNTTMAAKLLQFMSNMVHINSEAINTVGHAVTAAQQGKTTASLLRRTPTQIALTSLNEKAAKFDLELVTEQPEDISKFPTSFLSDPKTGKFTVFVHLPLSSAKFQMVASQLHAMPIKTEAGYFQLTINDRFLFSTQHPSSTFFSLSAAEFKLCTYISGERLVCPHRNVVMTPDSEATGPDGTRCLHALYTHNNKGVEKFCSIEPIGSKEAVFQVNPNSFHVFSAIPRRISLICDHDNRKSSTKFHNTVSVTIPPGCLVETAAHMLWPEITLHADNPSSDLVQYPDPIKALQNLTASILNEADPVKDSIAALLDRHQENLNYLSNADLFQDSFSSGHPTAILVIVIAIILLIACVILLCYKYSKKATAPCLTPGNVVVSHNPIYQPASAPNTAVISNGSNTYQTIPTVQTIQNASNTPNANSTYTLVSPLPSAPNSNTNTIQLPLPTVLPRVDNEQTPDVLGLPNQATAAQAAMQLQQTASAKLQHPHSAAHAQLIAMDNIKHNNLA